MKKIFVAISMFLVFNVFAINYDNYIGKWISEDFIIEITKENNEYFYKLYQMDFEYNKKLLEYESDAAYMQILDIEEGRVFEYPKQKLKLVKNGVEYKLAKYSVYRSRFGAEFNDKYKNEYLEDGARYLATFDKNKRYPGEDFYEMENNQLEIFKKIKKVPKNY